MVDQNFKSGPSGGLLLSVSCIFLFLLLWTFTSITDSTILGKHSPEPKHFYLLSISTESSIEEHSPASTFISEIPVKDGIHQTDDRLPAPDIEFSNISVLRGEMMKG